MKTSDLRLKLNEAMAQAQAWQKHIKIQQDIISGHESTIAQLKTRVAELMDPDVEDALSIQADLLITTITAGANWPIESPIAPPVVPPPVIVPPVNALPTIGLVTTVLVPTEPGAVLLTAAPFDSDGTIVKVECFRDDVKIAEKLVAPWTYTDTGLAAGSYRYREKVTDNSGGVANSAESLVTINLAVITPPPPQQITPIPIIP